MFIGSFNPCLLMFIDVYYSSLVLTNLYWLLMCIIMFMMGISTAGFMPTLPWGLKHWKPSFSTMCFFVGLIAESQPALDKDRISTTLSLNWARVSRISSSSVFSCQNLQTPDPCRGPETLNSSLICIFVEHGKTNRPTVIVLYHLVSSCIIVYHLNIYI